MKTRRQCDLCGEADVLHNVTGVPHGSHRNTKRHSAAVKRAWERVAELTATGIGQDNARRLAWAEVGKAYLKEQEETS